MTKRPKAVVDAWLGPALRRLLLGLTCALAWTAATTTEAATPPECFVSEPISCTMPIALTFVPLVPAYAVLFEDVCLKHDYCYRHGSTTYGYDKAYCDRELLAGMDAICRREIRPIDVVTLGLLRVSCLAFKRLAYAAVHTRRADAAFRTGAESTYCRYEEYLAEAAA